MPQILTVRRSYTTEVVEHWTVEIPDEYDADEWLENDMVGFDEHLTTNGELIDRDGETPDYNHLDITVTDTEQED